MENMNQDMIDLIYQLVDEVLVVVNKVLEQQIEVIMSGKQVPKRRARSEALNVVKIDLLVVVKVINLDPKVAKTKHHSILHYYSLMYMSKRNLHDWDHVDDERQSY